MAQYGRPVADITVGAWTTSPLWDKLDEVSSDDATTEITTGNNPSNVTGEVRLGSVADPNLGTGHVLRIRAYTTNNCTLAWALYQGTTLIANCGTITLGASYATTTYNLTEAEANAITNYSDLRIRITGNGSGRARVTWIEAQFPDQLIQKSGAATISGGKTISAAIRKAALVAAVFGVLGHVAAIGIIAYPLLLHGGGSVAVAGTKGVGLSVSSQDDFNTYLHGSPPPNPPWYPVMGEMTVYDWQLGGRWGYTSYMVRDSRIPAMKNQKITVRFVANHPDTRLLLELRVNDGSGTKYQAWLGTTNGSGLTVYKFTPTQELLVQTSAVWANPNDLVTFEVVGDALRFYINGILKWSAMDTSVASGEMAMGFYTGVNYARGIDDYSATVWSDEGSVAISGSGTTFATGKKWASNQDFITHAIDTFHRQAEGSFLGDDPLWSDGGSIKVKSGGIYCEVFGTGSNLYLGGSVPPADYFVQATVRGEGDNAFCGLIIREHYTCWFRDMFGDIVLWRDGEVIEQYPYPAFQVGDTIALSVSGSTITALVNGVPIRSWVDGTYSLGRAGVMVQGPSSGFAPVQMDDFIIGYNRGIFVSGNGNIYVWSEDHYGQATISEGGDLASLGSKSARSNKKAYDDFERPDGPLGTDWQPVAGMSPPNIVNGAATADSGGLQGALWAQYGGWPADQSVSVRVEEAGALQVGAILRAAPGNGRGYLVSVLQASPGRYWVFTNTGVGGWAWSWTSGYCSAIAAGDVLTFQVTGYPPVITIYKNGVWQAQHFPTPINQIASGIPGVAVNQWAAVDEWWGVLGAPSYASVSGGGTLSAAGWKNATPVYCRAKFMDNFNRSERDLGGDNGWYVPIGRAYGPQILSNQVKHKFISGFSDPEAVFQSFLQKVSVSERMQIAVKSYGDDYWREIQILAISPTTGKGFSLNLKPRTYLYFLVFDDFASNAFRNVGGYAGNANVLPGDRVEFIVYDDQWRVYQNGHLIGSGTDSALAQPDLQVGIQTMDPALSLSVDDLSAYCYSPGENNAISARGNVSLNVAKSLHVPIVIHGGGTVFASTREEARRSVAISGGGSVTLAGRAGARRTSSISGEGSVTLSAKPGWLAEPHVTGNGVWIATGDATFIDTASVSALIHGGGSVNAAGNKWNEGTAWTFGGGQVSVRYDRSWESVPIQKIDSPDSVCYLIKMEMDYCSRTFGTSPCLATGTRCYNTWKTCKYIAAYLATKKTYRYVSANFPQAFPNARPYVDTVKYMPTEIKTNLTVNARVSFTMLDEPDADVDTDPYWSTRSSHPGTYWKRWLARNTNYKDRIVRIYEGVYGRPESTYVQKWTGRLENIKVKGDKFTFEAVDLLKDLAKIEVPPKTNAKLALALAANAGQSFTITEDADKFPSSGYVRIDDEIIQYTALNVATKTFTIGGIANRAQFGTVAAAHAQNGKVQQAKFYAAKNPLEILLDILLGDAGMADSWVETANVNNVNAAFTTISTYVELGVAGSQSWPSVGIMKLENWSTPGVIEYVRYTSKTYVPGGVGVSPAWRFNFETYSGVMTGRSLFGTPRITGGVNSIRAEIGYFEYVDTDAFYQYRDWPARDIDFTSIISEPTKLSDLYMEIVDLLDAKSWVAENLKITIRKNTTNTPTTGYVSLSDADNIIEDSGSVDVNEKSRISRMIVYWDKAATGKASEEMSYRRLDIAIDPDAETNYGDPVEKVVRSRWIDPYVTLEETVQQFVKNLAIRRIQRCKHAQNLITVKVPEKDAGVKTGDYVRLSTDELLESDGNPISARMYQVVKRERGDKAVTLTFIQVTPRRMAVIAPAGLPAYPSATEVQRAYGYICDATGKMSDGTDGYFIW